ncbi:MAG: tRNA (5-methylaminomethyl-2-thiouridine)(34)-methyltransferase MnmD [Rikenellaceae bacterium]
MSIVKYKAEISSTEDGSPTLLHPILGDNYHSFSGALDESRHVYINAGLNATVDRLETDDMSLRIFEMGFGSGLNALLTIEYALKYNLKIEYFSIELYPLEIENVKAMNLDKFVDKESYDLFLKLLEGDWDSEITLNDNIKATKIYGDITKAELPQNIDLVYYDAFAYDTQPQLWSSELFKKIAKNMITDSSLTTYSAKGAVKEALRSAGFTVKRLKGAGGKHHMVLAVLEVRD